ncbi:MAG: hypothetical protein JSW08_02605 [archaeon]|nr:MAG: hypothetical protein JSW08_02605 [archaeon]
MSKALVTEILDRLGIKERRIRVFTSSDVAMAITGGRIDPSDKNALREFARDVAIKHGARIPKLGDIDSEGGGDDGGYEMFGKTGKYGHLRTKKDFARAIQETDATKPSELENALYQAAYAKVIKTKEATWEDLFGGKYSPGRGDRPPENDKKRRTTKRRGLEREMGKTRKSRGSQKLDPVASAVERYRAGGKRRYIPQSLYDSFSEEQLIVYLELLNLRNLRGLKDHHKSLQRALESRGIDPKDYIGRFRKPKTVLDEKVGKTRRPRPTKRRKEGIGNVAEALRVYKRTHSRVSQAFYDQFDRDQLGDYATSLGIGTITEFRTKHRSLLVSMRKKGFKPEEYIGQPQKPTKTRKKPSRGPRRKPSPTEPVEEYNLDDQIDDVLALRARKERLWEYAQQEDRDLIKTGVAKGYHKLDMDGIVEKDPWYYDVMWKRNLIDPFVTVLSKGTKKKK